MTAVDPRARHAALLDIAARLDRTGAAAPAEHAQNAQHGQRREHSEDAELAGLLPDTVPAAPESALLLADLVRRLWRHIPPARRPRWRDADDRVGLPARVRLAWLRAEIANEPATLRREPAGEPLYQAVAGIGAADTDRPDELLRELAGSADPTVRAEAPRLAREALHTGRLAPARVRAHLERLLDGDPRVTAAALAELARPWAALDPLPPHRLRRFLTATPGMPAATVEAAVAVAARHRHGDLLRDVAADVDAPPVARRRALRAFGDVACRADIGAVTALAATDPLLLGGPAVGCLVAMHRRGEFPGDGDAAGIVALAVADHTIPADDVATVVYTCRAAAVRALTEAGVDDPAWPRRLEVLIGVAGQGEGVDLAAIGDAVVAALAATCEAATPRPVPFLDAIRALRYQPAERAVIDALPHAPATALAALEAIGGRRTVAALEARLGFPAGDRPGAPPDDPAGADVVPYLRPVRHRALELLWLLNRDPDRRRRIVARLDPRQIPARIAADLGAPDPRELALLRANFDPDQPAQALLRLARDGDATTVTAIADLLLRIVADLAATWAPDSPTATVHSGRPGAEPAVPDEVVSAIRALGGRLRERGAIRPVCLLDAATAGQAGDALVATIALDLLDRPDASARERAILLALLLRVPYRGTAARVHRWLRHRDRHVRKHAIALLAADRRGARALSASLTTLTTARDPQTVRQALLALGAAGTRWASPAIAACLEHPNMNIKKTAASVLGSAGTEAAVPKLLTWLGRHDNPGFRAALVEALRAILGDAYRATVLAAAEHAEDARTRDLLLCGLDRPATGGGPVVDAPDPDITALRVGGWDRDTAVRLVAGRDLPAGDIAALRPMLADFVALASGTDAADATGTARIRPAVLRFVLRLCPAPWSDGEVAVLTRAAPVLVDGLADLAGDGSGRDELIGMLEAVAAHLSPAEAFDVITRIRALPPGVAGRRSLLGLLRRCGAVLTCADVDRALVEARRGPDPWRAVPDVLREAFAVTGSDPPLPSRKRLLELIEVFPPDGSLDRIAAIQPIDAPQWTIAERAGQPADGPRDPHVGDLDQPRSAALRARLLGMLDADEAARRTAAAVALRDWPEPAVRVAVLRAYLSGRADLPATTAAGLATVMSTVDNGELAGAVATGGEVGRERAARLAASLPRDELDRLRPLLRDWWQHGGPTTRAIVAGIWRLDEEALADGPLRDPDARHRDAAALAALRRRNPDTADVAPPGRDELLRLARAGEPEQVRRALTALAEAHEEGGERPDAALEALLAELLRHPQGRVRRHAHRIGRRVLPRPTYLRHTMLLLEDPAPDLVRAGVAALCHAGYPPAVSAVVGLLTHPDRLVRRAAVDGLTLLGPVAVPALRHAAGHARPDRRRVYTTILDGIAAAG